MAFCRVLRRAGLVVAVVVATLVPAASAAVPDAGADNGAQRFIVVLRDGADPSRVARDHARSHGARPDLIYRSALRGYAATMSPAAAARVAADPRVAFVEADQVVHAFGEVPTGVDRIVNPDVEEPTVGHLGIDGKDDKRVDVDVAVIDTGIDDAHPDLDVVSEVDCTKGGPSNDTCVAGGDDGNGHGTHVAGTIGAIDDGRGVVGPAPGARLWAVKVLSDRGSGYMSWIVAGIDHVTANAASIEVANMSLGCECTSDAMDIAIANSVRAGVAYAVAAGNSDKDASTFSPANHPDVLTVSALADFDGVSGGQATSTCRSDQDDTLADFSNFGSTVEIAAPGVCITSTWPGGGYNTISGTSMASPHAAGALALLASSANPSNADDVRDLYSTARTAGNSGWTDDSGDGVKEPLLDVSNTTTFKPVFTGGSGDSNAAPTASFTESCADLTCSFTDTSTDSDGTIASRTWDFGDGATSTAQDPSHTYPAAGTYTVSLTVTDDGGATSTTSHSVTVSSSSTSEISLTARGYKVKGVQHVDLTWSGSTQVHVYRNGSKIATTTTDTSSYTDNIGSKGGGSYTYKVCDTGSHGCSNEVTVTFS